MYVSRGEFFIVLFFLLQIVFSICTKLEVKKTAGNSEVARAQLQKIQEQTKHARYGKCWTEAFDILQTGCRNLNDDKQRRIAYAFARCHLQSSGRSIPVCPEETPIIECTNEKNLNDISFNAYTEFFTHTQEICFHLQSQVWHEATENTISRLSDNSKLVADGLAESSNIVKEVIDQQTASLKNQVELLKNDQQLRESMEKSVMDVHKSHAETKEIIQEQRLLFSEVFNRFTDLQKTILGQFTSVYSFGFYIGAIILAYILTSTPVTQSSRVWLFVLISLNAMTERIINEYYLGNIDFNYIGLYAFNISNASSLSDVIYERLWLCRKVYSCLALLLLIIKIIRFKDYNKINNQLLCEIKQELLSRREKDDMYLASIENFKTITRTIHEVQPQISENSTLPVNDAHSSSSETLVNCSDLTAIYNSTVKNETADVTVINNMHRDDGHESDATFHVSDSEESDTSCASIMTDCSSFSTTSSHHSFILNRSSRRSSTPLRDSLLYDKSFNKSKNRRRTTSFIKEETEGYRIGGYNLRRRPSTPISENSILKRESADDFARYMQMKKYND